MLIDKELRTRIRDTYGVLLTIKSLFGIVLDISCIEDLPLDKKSEEVIYSIFECFIELYKRKRSGIIQKFDKEIEETDQRLNKSFYKPMISNK